MNQQNTHLSQIEKATRALKLSDAKAIGEVADVLRFKHKMNYEQVVQFLVTLGSTANEVEWLLYEADTLEGQE